HVHASRSFSLRFLERPSLERPLTASDTVTNSWTAPEASGGGPKRGGHHGAGIRVSRRILLWKTR
ncbi:unnamed protein product, partial [Tilletia caries]